MIGCKARIGWKRKRPCFGGELLYDANIIRLLTGKRITPTIKGCPVMTMFNGQPIKDCYRMTSFGIALSW
jgi:hypothetical protein